MIVIAAVHRRMAEIEMEANRVGSLSRLSEKDQIDLIHCLRRNMQMIRVHDELTSLAKLSTKLGEREWAVEYTQKLMDFEKSMI